MRRLLGAATRRHFLFLVALALVGMPARATIEYQIGVARPEQHEFRVVMTIPDARGELTVELPAWNALYQVRDFAHHVKEVTATDSAGHPLRLAKEDEIGRAHV